MGMGMVLLYPPHTLPIAILTIDKMPSASSLFSAVFSFRKVVLEIFSELDTTKIEVPIFPGIIQKSEGESKMGTRWASP